MSWYYAKGSERIGPLGEQEWQGVVASGAISPDTLVWREGMPNWLPYSQIAGAPSAAAGPTLPGMVRCSDCGQAFPPDQVVQIGGRAICGDCKPLAVQRLREGVARIGETVDPEALAARIRERGYVVDIGAIFSGSWALTKANYWPCVGVTVLCYLIAMASTQIPILGLAAMFCVQPQMFAGLFWYYLKLARTEPAMLNDAFDGFRRGFGAQAGYMGIIFAGTMALIIPIIIVGFVSGTFDFSDPQNAWKGMFTIYGVMFIVMIPLMILFVRVLFAQILIIDKGLGALAALRLSWRATGPRFWKIVWLCVLLSLIGFAGALLCLVGVVFVAPVIFFAIVILYEDIFSEAAVTV